MRTPTRLILPLAAALLAAPAGAAEPETPEPRGPEFVEMLVDILKGSQMGPKDGWFHDSQSRYDWTWLASKADADGDGRITPAELAAPDGVFARLDRDGDRAVTAADLDWSDASPFLRQKAIAAYRFRAMDRDTDGRISPEEFSAFFDRASGEKGYLTPDDIHDALTGMPPAPPPPPPGSKPPTVDGAPTRLTLLKGLLGAEIGSPFAGPRPGTVAPDFALKTHDGSRTVRLSDFRGKRPVVLVFGNVTCGPFRQQGGRIDDLHRRYGDRFEFLMVYVREAHPTDGWRMTFNDAAEVALPQPRTDAERVEAATRCQTMLDLGMPLLVDAIDDRVGLAYSGMPSRLYLIDADGVVAFQSGRGPFGFKVGELEQALLMHLVDRPQAPLPAGFRDAAADARP